MLTDIRLIFWETTRACNLGCPHCRASATTEPSPEDLTTDEVKKFMEQAATFSRPILVFSGGEPILRNDLYELLSYANKLGLKPALATNATLISEEIAYKLKDNGLSLASVSIYGANAESHDSFCGLNGAFEKTLKGINNLKKAKVNVQINTTISKKNLKELEVIGDFALKIGAVAYHTFFLVPTGRGRYIEDDEISSQEYEKAFNRLYDYQKVFPLRIKATCAPHYYRILHMKEAKTNERSDNEKSRGKGCLAGQGVCFISHKGEVFGCGYLPIIAGNIRKQDFRDIWFKSELFITLRDNSRLQGKCGVCEFKDVCGGCRARAYAATGNYLEEDTKCAYQPLTKRF
ncbi:MAG: radical SAM protein [Candidatus Omnitrophota bacterium]